MFKNSLDIFNNLNFKTKSSLFLLLLLIFIIAFLEMLSITMIIPILSTLLAEDFNFIFLPDFFLETDFKTVCIIFLFLFIFKNLITIFFQKKKIDFLIQVKISIVNKIFKNYLEKDYVKLRKFKHGELTRNILNEPFFFFKNFIITIIDLGFEITIVTGLIIFLLLFNLSVSLSVFATLSLISLLILKYSSSKLLFLGDQRYEYRKQTYQIVNDFFHLIREIKIANKENNASNFFHKSLKKYIDAILKSQFYTILPKILLEIFIITCLIFIIIYLNENLSGIEIIGTLSIYAVAAFRLIPSFSKIAQGFQRIKFSTTSVDLILNELKEALNKEHSETKEVKFKNILFKNLSYEYENIKFKFDNFGIKKNEKICIMGKTGSGKTTLVNLLTGLLQKDKFSCEIDGIEKKINRTDWLNSFTYVPQNFYLLSGSIKENIIFFDDYNEQNFKETLNFCNCDFINDLKDKENYLLTENGMNLSGGQRQKIAIARSIYSKKNIIILDETTNEINSEDEKILLEKITSLNKTIIFITHNENHKKYFESFYKIVDHQLIKS